MDKVIFPDSFHSEWSVLSPDFSSSVIFSQPFVYLGNGSQSYVFVSQDQKFVIKFFKKKHLTPKNWIGYIKLPGLNDLCYKKIDKRKRALVQTFSAIKLAYDEFREESGLVYIHLNPSDHLKTHLQLLYLGRKFQVNLDEIAFLVQENVEPIFSKLTRLMKDDDTAGAVLTMRSLFKLIQIRGERGLIDLDSGLGNNFGSAGDRAIQIDIGRLVHSQNPSHTIQEIKRIGKTLKDWIGCNYPELLPDLDNLMTEFCNVDSGTYPQKSDETVLLG